MELSSLQDLFVEELRDLYSAENQLVKALPKMAKAATNDELRQGLKITSSRRRVTSSGWKRSSISSARAPRAKPAKP